MAKKSKKVTAPEPSAPPTIVEACRDPKIFGAWFHDAESWSAWLVFLKTLFGLPLDADELAAFQNFTGRNLPNPAGYFDASLIVGRRGGKSLILAATAAYLATFVDWSGFLTGGERATIMVIAADKKQAGTIFRYLREMLDIPMFKGSITRETNELLELSSGVAIEVVTASYRTIRGRTVVAALCDELAFWRTDDGANPDSEIIAALKPSMATVKGARLLKASSPYSRRGVLWNDYRRHYGKDDSPTLVWKAATRDMNPGVPESFIAAAYKDDPASAAAEYGAEFRTDVGGFVDATLVEAAVDRGVMVRPPSTLFDYASFCDPSGGARDSFTACVCHQEDGATVLDCLLEIKPPFNPIEATQQVAAMLKSYGLTSTTGGRYAAEWVVSAFAALRITYQHSERDRSAIYSDALTLFTSGRARLLDNQKLVNQFAALERRTSPNGKDRIDHGVGGSDDLANACAGAMTMAATPKRVSQFLFG